MEVILSLVRAWLPAGLWMLILFVASTDLGAPQSTSRFLVPFLRWLAPDLSTGSLEAAQFALRKTGHVSAYAVLAVLWWRARRSRRGEGRAWQWSEARFAWAGTTAYACTDEWHQSFTNLRQASGWDVALDALGAGLGLAMVWCWTRWRTAG